MGEKGLWADVLLQKYMLRNKENLLEKRPRDSALWKFITDQKEVVEQGMGWLIRNGRSVQFFKDKWLLADVTIKTNCLRPLTEEEENSVVADWVVDGMWDFQKLGTIISSDIFRRLMAKLPPKAEAGDDVMIWLGSSNGNFSVRIAYNQIEIFNPSSYGNVYKEIWKWRGVERIKVFM